MSVRVSARPVQLKLSTRGRIEMARATLVILEKQARAGVSATGAAFGQGLEKRIDLHDSGRLFRDVVIFRGRLSFRAPYAGFVADKWKFLAIAPQYRSEYERAVTDIARRELRAEQR